MVLTAARVTAKDAVPTGLVNRAFPTSEEASSFAQAVAVRIAALPPAAVRQAKRALQVARDTPLTQGLMLGEALERSLRAVSTR